MRITKVDLTWNFAATFLKIASAAVLLPFILKMMPAEMVGIWTIFITITAFSSLLDFGFAPSFTRNITYVFSGVKELKKNGFETIGDQDKAIDYGLLKGGDRCYALVLFKNGNYFVCSTCNTWNLLYLYFTTELQG